MSGDTAATFAGGVVGGIIGFVITGGNPLGAQVGFSLGAGLTASLVADDIVTEGPRLDDLNPRPSAYGTPIAVAYGTIQVPGHIDWLENNALREVITEEEVGGKGGPTQTVETASYFATFGATLCEGPIAAVRRIWLDAVLVYDWSDTASAESLVASVSIATVDTSPGDPESLDESVVRVFQAPALGNVTFYTGTEGQHAHPREEADRGAGNVPGYRGRARIVWADLPLERWGNRLPTIRVEVIKPAVPKDMRVVAQAEPITDQSNQVAVHPTSDGLALVAGAKEVNQGDGMPEMLVTPDLEISEQRQIINANPTSAPSIGPWGRVNLGDYDASRVLAADPSASTLTTMTVTGGQASVESWLGLDPADTLGDPLADDSFNVTASSGWLLGERAYFLSQGRNILAMWNLPAGGTSSDPAAPDARITPVDSVRSADLAMGIDYDTSLLTVFAAGDQELRLYDADLNLLKTASTGIPMTGADSVLWFESGEVLEIDGRTLTYWSAEENLIATETLTGAAFSDPGRLVRQGNIVWAQGGRTVALVQLDPLVAVAEPLADVVSDITQRCGLDPADVDLTGVTGDVRGYALSRPVSARSALSPLRAVHRVDFPEIDYQLRGVSRGGSSVATLGADDLAAHEHGQEVPALLPEQQADRADLPQRVQVEYLDPATDYETGRQYASRASRPAGLESRIPLALSLSADEAAQAADVILREAWAASRRWSVSVPLRRAALMPSDVVTLGADGVSATARIERVDDGRPGIRRLALVSDGAAVYTSTAQGQAGAATTQAPELAGPTRMALMQLPALRDQDAAAGTYAAAGALLSGWRGAALYRSMDAGESFTRLTGWATSALLGTATAALGAPESGAGVWDRGSVLTVRIPDAQGAPVSVTEAAILADTTAALWAVASGDDWELLQVADWAQQSDGTWQGTTLLRGRYATEHAMAGHAVGDQVVRLNTAGGVVRVASNLADVGREVLMRAVTFGSRLESAADVSHTPRAEALRPWTPAHLQAPATPGGDLDITWVRRARLGGLGKLVGPVALVESTEAYRVDISRAGTPLRTTEVNTSAFTYTAAQQTTDGVSTGETLDIDVTQLGQVDGRTASVSVTAP